MEKNITLDLGLYTLEEIILNYYKEKFNDDTVKIITTKCYDSEKPGFLVKTKKILNFYRNSGFQVTLEDALNIINMELNKRGRNIDSCTIEGKINDCISPKIKLTISKIENTLVKTK